SPQDLTPDRADALGLALGQRTRLAAGVPGGAPRGDRRVQQVRLGYARRRRWQLDLRLLEQAPPLDQAVGGVLRAQGPVRELAERDLGMHLDHAAVGARVLVDLEDPPRE